MATYEAGAADRKDADDVRFPKFSIQQILNAPNLVDLMTESERKCLKDFCESGYRTDKESRVQWEANNALAMEMALQVVEEKSEPWEGASNIRFPLISIAVLHYHARVYPLMVTGEDPVHCLVYGPDPDGKRNERATRVGKHTSWQLREQIAEWEEEHDKMLFIQGILGLGIKKSWFDTALRRQRSQAISPEQLVFNYWSRGPIDMYTRATLVYEMSSNEIHSMVAQGLWCGPYDGAEENDGDGDADDTPQAAPERGPMDHESDKRTGAIEPAIDGATPFEMYEQICWLDLDGDGYAEPYFVTWGNDHVLRRVVARFAPSDVRRNAEGTIILITPEPCYTAYPLIPSPDGSAYPVGFGRLLGSLDDACSTALNQLFDAGTLANYGGGFIGRGGRMRGGQLRIKPGMWSPVDVVGGDLKNNIVPYPNPQPSAVLFQLVQYLVQYAERLVSANELQTGENIGQNTPAATAQTMDINGGRIVAGIYKRAWRAFNNEVQVIAGLNRRYITVDEAFRDIATGTSATIMASDYQTSDYQIRPIADPSIINDSQLESRDREVMQMADQLPNFNRYEATRRYLQSRRVPAIDRVYPPLQPGTKDVPQPPSIDMLKLQDQQQQTKAKLMTAQSNFMKAKAAAQVSLAKLQAELGQIQANIFDLQADAVLKLSQAKSENEGKEIALINSAIGARKLQMDSLMQTIGHLLDVVKMSDDAGVSDVADQAAGGAAGSNAGAASNGAGNGGSNGGDAVPGLAGGQGIFSSNPTGGAGTL